VLPKTMPRLFELDTPTPQQLIVCRTCQVLYDGKSARRLDDGTLLHCPAATKTPGVACGAALVEEYMGNGGILRVRPLQTHTHVPLAEQVRCFLQRRDVIYYIINGDRQNPHSFRNDKWYADMCEEQPGLDGKFVLFVMLYIDFFKFLEHARDGSKGQAGSVWLRSLNLPPHLAKIVQSMMYFATLSGAWGCFRMCVV